MIGVIDDDLACPFGAFLIRGMTGRRNVTTKPPKSFDLRWRHGVIPPESPAFMTGSRNPSHYVEGGSLMDMLRVGLPRVTFKLDKILFEAYPSSCNALKNKGPRA